MDFPAISAAPLVLEVAAGDDEVGDDEVGDDEVGVDVEEEVDVDVAVELSFVETTPP